MHSSATFAPLSLQVWPFAPFHMQLCTFAPLSLQLWPFAPFHLRSLYFCTLEFIFIQYPYKFAHFEFEFWYFCHVWIAIIPWSFYFIDEAVEIQGNLLDPLKSHLKPDDRFLQIFARVVGNHWPHLASQLSLSTRDIMEELKRRERSPPADQALYMLQKWKSKEEATYGLLCERLRTVSIMLW